MPFRSQDSISAKEGRIFFEGEELAYAKSIEATSEKNKVDVNVLGRRWLGKKTTGISGTGTLVLYKVTSKFIRLMLQYAETGEDAYFTIQSVLDDKSSKRGTERVTLREVNFDSVMLAQMDADGDVLQEEIPFTFEGADLQESLRDDI